ncbi:glutathione S-transferase C-terminal domain-containing protein [Hyphomonas johnsonii]|uniref:Glutathione S-transferase domain-containing protein n=1 Tax=Hyphomonas johnsonii MHS-2 TaxID=1280950 RepID=A0A059FUC3_9PROT|nr:glutathione S-transferase C-terminal domain-containing protein [Hyphomonas johnsonii]KCZ94091.1 glutathione S-transferase domain-containing protein [Hyphomonas johnsonii MHS-2]
MKLYFTPLACSLADHIALEELGLSFEREKVDLKTKRTASGGDFLAINPKGYVPVLVLDDGETLTENIAVLDWLASGHPEIAVSGPLGRTRALEMMTYISTEIHRSFKPMWHPSTDAEKASARATVAGQLRFVADHMAGPYLFGDTPSVADFYLFVMLLWAARFDVAVPNALIGMRDRMKRRPAVQAAMRVEGLILDAVTL